MSEDKTKGKQDEVKPNLFQRLNAIKAAVEYLKKDDSIRIKTKAGNVIEYAAVTHDAVTAAIRQHFVEHGVFVIESVKSFEQRDYRTIVEVELTFVNVDDPQDKFSVVNVGYGDDSGDKGPGKAQSYAVKVAYLKNLQLETGESDESRYIPESKGISAKQHEELQKLLDETGKQEAAFVGYLNNQQGLGIETLADLPKGQFAFAKGALESAKAALAKKASKAALAKKASKAKQAEEAA